MIFPWALSQWQQLVQRVNEQRLPHAMLFCGIEGLGKFDVARKFAQSLLCQQPDDNHMPCNQCRSCSQFEANTHPDYLFIEPDEEGKAIKVDQIRLLVDQFGLASHYGAYRVAIINPAESMNLAAANSLLKSLEEPPDNTVIILVSSQSASLPSTILSRCQRINFSSPSTDMAVNWLNKHHSDLMKSEIDGQESALLAMANGAPLKAIKTADSELIQQREQMFELLLAIADGAESALGANKQWLKAGITTPIQWVYSWISDLIKVKIHLQQAIVNHDKSADLQKLAQQVELSNLYSFLDSILDILKKQRAPLNTQMIMDDLLLDWEAITATKQS